MASLATMRASLPRFRRVVTKVRRASWGLGTAPGLTGPGLENAEDGLVAQSGVGYPASLADAYEEGAW